jgi:xylan 1,4-beta-xylosidase
MPFPVTKSRTWPIVALLVFALTPAAPARPPQSEVIHIDAKGPGHPFPHFWEKMFGSGRAALSLRESYRQDLASVKAVTNFEYVRFHAIFDDELGLYKTDGSGNPVYNFSYIDQIYDGLLANGVRPFVELSFMPADLASSPQPHAFWYKPLPNPPKSYARWGEMVGAFVKHLVDRYGADEVLQWYFEVWNEPNIDFWTGVPKQATYFELYDAAARAIKAVNPRLRVGGPATAQAAWVPAFIDHCVRDSVPVDFVSTHVYGNDSSENVFGTHETISRRDMVGRAVRKVYDEVKKSQRPDLPIIWSEYNASYKNELNVTDSPFMGPWLANNIRECDGLTTMMSYWTFSDVFEEQGVIKTPFYGGYGLIAEYGIPKAAYNAFALLHKLGDTRIDIQSDDAIATRRADGTLAIAVWNYAPPGPDGAPQAVTLDIDHLETTSHVRVTNIDANHGSALTTWEALNRPAFPTRDQIAEMKIGSALPSPVIMTTNGKVQLTLPSHGLALVEIVP